MVLQPDTQKDILSLVTLKPISKTQMRSFLIPNGIQNSL